MKKIVGNRDKRENVFLALTFVTIILVCFRMFFKLNAIGITDDDEAWHISNAYDMFKNSRWIINTHGGMVDYYNSKPPLALIPIIISIKLFGPTLVAVKIPAALEGIATCVILVSFLTKKYSAKEALAFSTLFLMIDYLFDYHMYRTANLDALFSLFFVLVIICLEKAREKSAYLMIAGFFVGQAFLTKSFHVMCIIPICLFSIPFADKENRLKNVGRAIVISLVTVIPWAVKRFMFDGTSFFHEMLFGEVNRKVTSGITWEYLLDITKGRIFKVLAVALILYLCAVVITKASKRKKDILTSDCGETAIYWLGLIVPVAAYSVAGSYYTWYIYPSYIMAAIICSIYICKAAMMIKSMNLLYIGIVVLSLILGGVAIYNYRDAGMGGGQANEYWGDLREVQRQYGTKYNGSNIYIQNVSRNGDDEIDFFHDDLFAYSVLLNDFYCENGGIEAWLKNKDGILILNKGLWEKYQGVLAGHVILQDNGYLWFLPDMY